MGGSTVLVVGAVAYGGSAMYFGAKTAEENVYILYMTIPEAIPQVDRSVDTPNDTGGTGKWTNPDGSVKYPPNNGFEGAPTQDTLQPGTVVDRYGAETGRYASPQGAPFANRSLPPGTNANSYNAYEVIKPINVQSGTVAPWFDQPGGGLQYQFSQSINDLVNSGFLRRLP